MHCASAPLRRTDAQERRFRNHGGVRNEAHQTSRQSAVHASELLVHNTLEDQITAETMPSSDSASTTKRFIAMPAFMSLAPRQ